MYDPARDVFTAGEDVQAHAPVQARARERSESVETANGDGKDETKPIGRESERGQGESLSLPASEVPKNEIKSKASETGPTKLTNASPGLNHLPKTMPEKRKRSSASPEASAVTSGTASSSRPPPQATSTDKHEAHESTPSTKRQRLSPPKAKSDAYASPVPMTSTNLPRFSRKKPGEGTASHSRRSRSPARDTARRVHRASRSPQSQRSSELRSADRRRERPSPVRRRSRSPPPRQRSPTPPPRSPPRKLKRPGGGARIGQAEREALRQRQVEREKEQVRTAQQTAATRGVHDVVKQHYNAVPERGRDWRRTDSQIRGLRSFNNWVKSTIIQKFSPDEGFSPPDRRGEQNRWAEGMDGGGLEAPKALKVLDMGCGKGGDLGKWQQAPQPVELYVGVDPADVSIDQARERYRQTRDGGGRGGRGGRGGYRGGGRGPQGNMRAEFFVKDAFGEWLGDIPLIRDVGIDGSAGPGAAGAASARWGGGGFDVVSMMFCMHYAFESESKARGMLKNVSGALKKGGRLIGVIPNSDMLSEHVVEYHAKRKKDNVANGTAVEEGGMVDQPLEWGNSIYRVRFPGKTPEDGIFMPPFGWKYSFFLEEAIEEVPEYVVPWEAFRAIAEDYNLEMQYRKPFTQVWREEKNDPVLGPLSERMGVRDKGTGEFKVSNDEMEAASFYLAFCFYKV